MRSFLLLTSLYLLCSCCTARDNGASCAGDCTDHRARAETGARADSAPDGPAAEARSEPAHTVRAVVNAEYEEVVLDLLAGATQSIHVVHFECNEDAVIGKIVKALKDAAGRGVQVTALFEAEVDDNAGQVEELVEAGVQARLDTDSKYTHAKLVVVDDQRVLLGSTNFSYKSIRYNNETNLLLESPAAGLYFRQYAQALYDDPAAVPALTPVADPEAGLVRVLHDGDYVAAVTPLLKNAQSRAWLLVYGFSLNDRYPDSDVHKLADALIAAGERGVDVRVMVEESDYNDTLNGINKHAAEYLSKGCVPVRFDPIDVISHAKLLVVDGTVVVGSNNWGHGGFHLYHEVGGIVDDADVVAKLADYFTGIWDVGTLFPSACEKNN